MKNKRVILLAGYARGGTNLAWNILQSHPAICTPIHETGEIFDRSTILKRVWGRRPRALTNRLIDARLFRLKLETLQHPDNRFRAPDTPYTRDEVSSAILGMKSVNDDIALSEVLRSVYPDLTFVGLTRNGYALCDGYYRRGVPAKEFGALYARVGGALLELTSDPTTSRLIRFEDVLADPFQVAEALFAFLGLEPPRLPYLRFKMKRTVTPAGEHTVAYGEEDRKYWFTREEVGTALNRDIDQTQSGRVPNEYLNDFEELAGLTLRRFGYLRQDADNIS